MTSSHRIAVVKVWTERHAHRSIKLAEDGKGRIWLRLLDLRQWMPGLTADAGLLKTHPSRVAMADNTTALYIEASAFAWLTQKSSSVQTLKLRAWLEASVLAPARRRHQWEDYQGRESPLLPSELEVPLRAEARELTEVRMPWRSSPNPGRWLITRGQLSLQATLLVGLIASLFGVMLSVALNDRAWEVEGNYRIWTWGGILVALWALLWNSAWGVGAVRGAIRISRQDAAVWKIAALLIANLVFAALTAMVTLANTKMLVESWWVMYRDGDPPVNVHVASMGTNGVVTGLLVSGPIGIGSTKALRAALDTYPDVKVVELNSPGGLVVEGYGMTNLLVAREVNTQVIKRCASACTFLFLAGVDRVLGPQARVGFHRSYSILGGLEDGWSETDHEIARWMMTRGVNPAFVREALDTPGSSIWVPSHDRMLADAVATRVDDSLY